MNLLFVDIEGGWGGSSRSLYFLVKHLDKNRYRPFVLLGKKGPAELLYQAANIKAHVFYPIPRTTAIRKKNWRSLIRFLLQLIHLPRFIRFIKHLIKENDLQIIHLNHESLFFVGFCFKMMFNVKLVCHVRTMLPNNIWAKTQIFIALYTGNHLIFITENERDLWHCMWQKTEQNPQSVIHNIAGPVKEIYPHKIMRMFPHKFKVISLMTISFLRGIDRLVDVALSLRNRCAKEIVFVLCGKTDDEVYERSLRQRIRIEGLDEYLLFLGHQLDPEDILSECDVLIRPSREYNPWGRDVIEALAIGKPVIAIGTYDKFVEDGVNGYLFAEFDAEKIAEKIIYLSEHPKVIERMRKANIEKAKRLFDGPTNAAKVAAIYESLIKK